MADFSVDFGLINQNAFQQGVTNALANNTAFHDQFVRMQKDNALRMLATNPDDMDAQARLMAADQTAGTAYQTATIERRKMMLAMAARAQAMRVAQARAGMVPGGQPIAAQGQTQPQIAPPQPQMPAPSGPPGTASMGVPFNALAGPQSVGVAGAAGMSAPPASPQAPMPGDMAQPHKLLGQVPPGGQSQAASQTAPSPPPSPSQGQGQGPGSFQYESDMLAGFDPDYSDKVQAALKNVDSVRLARLSEAQGALGTASNSLLNSYPMRPGVDPGQVIAQRKAAAQQMLPQMAQHGVTPDMVAGADFSDAGLHNYVAQAVGLQASIENEIKSRDVGVKEGTLAEDTRQHTLAATAQVPVLRPTAGGGSDLLSFQPHPELASATGQAPGAGGAGGGPSSGSAPVPPGTAAVAARIAQVEGTAPNPRSSASGVGQFTNSTWLQCYRQYIGGQGMSDAQILAQKSDQKTASYLLQCLTDQNTQALQQKGFQPSPTNVYLAHVFGIGGAATVLHSDPNTPLSQILPANVIRANPSFRNMTVSGVESWAAGKMGDSAGGQQGTSATPSNASLLASDGTGGALTPGALDRAAQEYNATGKMPDAIGRNGLWQRQVLNEADRQLTAAHRSIADVLAGRSDYAATAKSLEMNQPVWDRVQASERTALANGRMAVSLAEQVGNGRIQIWNQWRNDINNHAGDPNIAKLNTAINVFVNEAANVVSLSSGGGATTDSQREHIRDELHSAQSLAQFKGVFATYSADMANKTASMDQQKQIAMNRLRLLAGNGQPSSQQPASVPTLTPAQARAAPSGTHYRTTDGRYGVRP